MKKLKLVVCAVTSAVMSVGTASAGSYITLGTPSGSSSVTTLGKAPVKEKKILKLGALRTGEAQLPNGIMTLDERMRMRARQARKRQKAVSRATRYKKPPSSGSDMQSYDSSGDTDMMGESEMTIE